MSEASPRRRVASVAIVAASLLLFASLFVVLRQGAAPGCDQPTAHLTAQLGQTGMDPFRLEFCRGQQVELTLISSVDGFVHIHGEIDEAAQVFDGQALTMRFEAVGSEQQPMELHTDSADSVVGVLIIHDP